MNINILNILSPAWLKLMSPYMLFGLYYGLLATLPVGPSQILCLRSFLLGGNLSGLVSLSGSMLAQLITTSAIYCSPIYIMLSKPHLLTVAIIPYALVFCLAIKDLPNYQVLRPVTSLRDSRIIGLFCNSFLFQILNPILLPNPVLARLTHLFFFRYSHNVAFVITSFLGWLAGHVAFSYLSRLLLVRVEKDSPIIHLLVKRALYTTFSIVFIMNALVYLGRAPVSFWTKKFINEPHDKEMSFWEIAEYSDLLWWFFKPWPTSFFDPSRGNRGNRFVRNCRSDMNSSFYRGRISTYFFDKCLTDGKQRLSFAALPSLSIFEKQLKGSLVRPNRRPVRTRSSYRGWILEKLVRNKIFQKELTDRVKLLDTGSSFSKAMERRTRLMGRNKKRIPQVYDPFANNFRMRIPVPQTFLTADEFDLSRWKSTELETRRKIKRGGGNVTKKNSIEAWISAKNRKLKQGKRSPLPWETLPAGAKRIFQFMFKNRVLFDYDVQKILKKIKSSSKPGIAWEEIMNLDYDDRALFLIYLKGEESYYKSNRIKLSNVFLVNSRKQPLIPRKRACTLHKIEDLRADLARTIEIYFDNDFDVPGADSDIRYRKLRNVGITFAKGKPRSTRLVKRYARVSDFRRKFLKGSMRSRRRKTLLWKTLQEKVHSAFFLRLMEIPILSQLPVKQLAGSNPETTLTDAEKNADYQFEQQPNIFSLAKKHLSESKLARSAIAARTDIGPIHNGRGYMLVFQSRFRKYIKLPVLIVIKSTSRVLLRQDSEWNKDWTEWKKEIHINRTFDGEEFSQDQLPPRWLREGLQIKIVYPFRLKPWHTDASEKRLTHHRKYMETEFTGGQKSRNKKGLKQKRPKFTHSTALGYQTDIPFGTIQKQPPFWKPVKKELMRTCRKGFSLQAKRAYYFIDSKFELGKVLKPSLIALRKLNLFSEARKISTDSVSNDNTGLKTASEAIEIIESKPNTGKYNGGSISIGGEVQPTSTSRIGKRLVAGGPVNKKEFVAINIAARFANPLNEEGVDEPDAETTRVGETAFDDRLKGIDLADSAKFEGEKPIGSKEMILKLRIFIAEEFEKHVSAILVACLKVDRKFAHHFNEFAALYAQLAQVMNNTIGETDFSAFGQKKRFPRFDRIQSLSQACLCGDVWNIGVKKYLNLDLLVSSDSTSYQTERSLPSGEDVCRPSTDYNSYTLFGSGEINTSIGSSVSCVDNTADEVAKKLINVDIKKNIEEWGFLKKLRDLDASNWNKWLDRFSRCNLPLAVWRDVAPQKWRVSLDCSNELGDIEQKVVSERGHYVLQSKLYNYSIYVKKPLLKDRVGNFSRLRRHRYLLQNLIDFLRNGDIQNASTRQDALAQRLHSENRIRKIGRGSGNKTRRFLHRQNSDAEIRLNSKLDLMSWLIPDPARAKGFFRRKTKRLKDPVLRDQNTYGISLDISRRFQKVSNELYEVMLDEREDADYIFRWKWKSEVELEKLRNLIALTRMLGNDRDLATLCDNTDVDSYLSKLYFDAKTKLGLFDDLCILSAHRLPILFDDQNLVYKIINPLLKFKSRSKRGFKKRLYRNVYSDTYISNMLLVTTEGDKEQSCISNIEDLLLPRRRREFRFLRSLLISRSPRSGTQRFDSIPKIGRTRSSRESQLSKLSEVQKIKRFLWPSHRLEELACTGRFCFNITTGSRFAMLNIRMYPIIQN
uniref:conserved hypothetical chloroplast protein Ycf1 n=1 Tax=Hiya brooksiae TaxID=2201366 RepID=UPI002E771BE0|nr:conserved hypothetical chloroplast protein Ycf1 [Hiya brooksiae]WQT71164.1 conserved hypothetical chloroplast protein Ycf1 [Hiya brooksiae]